MIRIHGERQEQFKKECRIINLRYEYYGYTGNEKWEIVSEMTEREIKKSTQRKSRATRHLYSYPSNKAKQ